MSSKVLAAVVLFAIGMRIALPLGLTVGYVLAAMLFPLWLPMLRRYKGAVTLFVVGLAAAASGVILTELARSTHVVINSELANSTVGIVGILCSIGFVLWTRRVFADWWVAVWFGLGLVASVTSVNDRFLDNPWRFGFSFAITVFALALASVSGRRWLDLAAVLGLTVVSMFTDARSSFAILLLTAILVAWQMRPARPTRSKSAARVVIAIVALSVVVYNFGQAAIVAGYFGEATRERTVEQLDTAGSLILGGRPEIAATFALMQHNPVGFGAGTLLNPDEILAAKTGMSGINYEPNNGYVENYMFGDRIELHSLFGDLWARFGIAGLVFAAVILFLTLRGVGAAVTSNAASGILIFLVVNIVWAFFFGPLHTGTRVLILGLALVLIPKESAPLKLPPGLRIRQVPT